MYSIPFGSMAIEGSPPPAYGAAWRIENRNSLGLDAPSATPAKAATETVRASAATRPRTTWRFMGRLREVRGGLTYPLADPRNPDERDVPSGGGDRGPER